MDFNWEGMITFFATEDLKRTDEFYADALGFELYMDQGKCRIYSVPGGGKIGFCTHFGVNVRQNSPIITFVTQDVDEVYKRLSNRGIKMNKEPSLNPNFPIYHFFVEDPNGYKVEIQRFTEALSMH